MNFLAHLYLSGDFDELMIGNFMADFVKGKPALSIHPLVIKGIELHRHIDYYTDTHFIVKESKERLRTRYRKYAGVIVDMFYDHFLAANWPDYSKIPLPEFASQTYQLMNQKKQLLPPGMHMLLHYMQGMAKRTTFQSDMELAVHDLQQDYHLYQAEFINYFPELIRHVSEWKKINL
jgi:acyl carrier protein phosphodiesterase